MVLLKKRSLLRIIEIRFQHEIYPKPAYNLQMSFSGCVIFLAYELFMKLATRIDIEGGQH
jgi:hypothetical protein